MYKKMLNRRIATFVAAAVLSLSALPATAQTHVEVEGGRSYMDNHGTDVAFLEAIFNENSIGGSRFTWAPDISTGWVDGRNLHKYDQSHYSTEDNVWLLAAGGRFRYGDASDWYHHVFFSFQGAGQTGRTQALSSSYEFVSTLGLQWKVLSLQVRHISNGGTHGPNRGETMGLVGVGLDF